MMVKLPPLSPRIGIGHEPGGVSLILNLFTGAALVRRNKAGC